MIYWEEESLNDREKIFEFLYEFNPEAAERTDEVIEKNAENLLLNPLMGVEREGIRGRVSKNGLYGEISAPMKWTSHF